MVNIRDLISRVNSIEVLVIVYENPGINQMVATSGDGKGTKIKRLKELVDGGLIREVSSSEGRTNKRYYLTQEGERIVKNWLFIENGGDVTKVEPINHGTPLEEGRNVS